MRPSALVAVLLLVPLSGCVGELPQSRVGLFQFDTLTRGDPAPVPAADCGELLATLNQRALDQARVALEQSVEGRYGHWGGAVALRAEADSAVQSAASGPPSGSAHGAQVTGTNNQEAAADEADILKTDGEWTYVLAQGMLRILHSRDVGDVESYGSMALDNHWGGTLLLEPRDPSTPADDRLVLVLPTWGGAQETGLRVDAATASLLPGSPMTRIVVLSLADRRAPTILEETWIEGSPAGARLIDGTAYVVVQAWEQGLPLQSYAHPDEEDLKARGLTWDTYWSGSEAMQRSVRRDVALDADRENQRAVQALTLADHLPVVLETTTLPYPAKGTIGTREPIGDDVCQRILVTPGSTGRAVSTILAARVADAAISTSTTQVLAGSSIVYASGDSLVLAAPSQDFWWFWVQPDLEEATDLHWFRLDGLQVTLHASGRVPGIVQDSFGLDVEGDELRVATTTGTWGRWWLEEPEPMLNHVAVFTAVAGQLVPKGMVGGIAPGERIWSARFTEDRAYLVTFRNIDPLWVIDLSGEVPEVLGELEIPGVSTYIHPLDRDTLLTIGYGPGPGPTQEGLDWSRIQVSLFDISNPAAPRRADVLDLSAPSGWSHSAAAQEHKAFTYWEAIGTLAVPLTVHQQVRTFRDGSEGYTYDTHMGLQLVTVDRKELDLRLRGEVDQDILLAPGTHWWGEVLRSYFLGFPESGEVSVYAMSDLGVTAHDLSNLRLQDHVAFEAPRQ